MKIYKFIGLFLVFILATPTMAQQSADEILNDLAKKTNAYQNIKVGFSYQMDNAEADIHEKTEGALIVSGDKYKLNIAGQEIISDGKTIWTYIADANEVQINEVDAEESFSPTKLLSSYTQDYKASLEKELSENNRSYYLFKLKPKDQNSSFNYALLKVDKEKLQVASFTLFDAEDNSFSYVINEYLTDVALPDNTFRFDEAKYPDVDVIDMR